MRQAGVVGCRRARRTRTTRSDPTHLPAPNLVARTFTVVAPNQLWVGDITSIPTWEGWLYLATVLDAFSRRVIGWAVTDHPRGERTRDALTMALTQRQPAHTVLHHTDRGSQYTATSYQALLAVHGVTASMSREEALRYDNAMAESFFATLKTELIDRQAWPTRRHARQAIVEWIEGFYNRQRLHSALGYLSPVDVEEDNTHDRLVT